MIDPSHRIGSRPSGRALVPVRRPARPARVPAPSDEATAGSDPRRRPTVQHVGAEFARLTPPPADAPTPRAHAQASLAYRKRGALPRLHSDTPRLVRLSA